MYDDVRTKGSFSLRFFEADSWVVSIAELRLARVGRGASRRVRRVCAGRTTVAVAISCVVSNVTALAVVCGGRERGRRGGAHVTQHADMSNARPRQTTEVLEGALNISRVGCACSGGVEVWCLTEDISRVSTS